MKRFISILLTAVTLVSVFSSSGCKKNEDSVDNNDYVSVDDVDATASGYTEDPYVTKEITNSDEPAETDDSQTTVLPEDTTGGGTVLPNVSGSLQPTAGTTVANSGSPTDTSSETSTATSQKTSAASKTSTPSKTAVKTATAAPSTSAAKTTAPSKTVAPTTTAAPAEITIVDKNGNTSYKIYRDKWAEDLVEEGGATLQTLIKQKTGAAIQYLTDDQTAGTKEILVGNTNRSISDEAMVGLYENQFRFLCKNGSVAIVATNNSILDLAVKKFVEEYYKNGVLKIPEELDRKWQCEPKSSTTVTAENPICEPGDDPFITYRNGVYYYLFTANGAKELRVATATSLDQISRDNAKSVYSAPAGTDHSKQLWAPEMFYLQGEWYIYVAASDGDDVNHRMHVLKCTTQNPTDPFEYIGKIADTTTDKWAIDGTILEYNNELYMIWSGWQGDNDSGNQHLYIAHMSNPWTIDGKRNLISSPSASSTWDKNLNEGPCILKRGGKIFLLFSAYGGWTQNYCVGYLELTGTDPLKKASWTKNSRALLQKNSIALAPGHNCVVPAADGSWWIVYHAQPNPFPGEWKERNLWIHKLDFDENGKPKTFKSSATVTLTVPNGWVVKNEIV